MKKPHLIVLKGVSNSGKTTTIKLLYNMLIKDDNVAYYSLSNRKVNVETKALVYKNSTLIGIVSAGDNSEYIINQVKKFIDIKCAIIVCTCHPSHTSLIESYTAQLSAVNYLNKDKAKNQETAKAENIENAELIARMICDLIKNQGEQCHRLRN
jgi:adenylate kinase